MLTIGLTGGVGSGKTTVTRHFSSLGVPVIDADELARQLVEPGQPAYRAIIEEFGQEILTQEKTIDRPKLRRLIFANSNRRVVLESILHPLVREEVQRQIEKLSAPYCIVSIPLLIETGQTDIVDRILVINSPRQAQISRTVARDGVSAQEVEAIIAAQVGSELRLSMADDVLENNGNVDEIYPKVEALHQEYLKLAGIELEVEDRETGDLHPVDDEVESDLPTSDMPMLSRQNANKPEETKPMTNTKQVVYELPLNEKMRTFIRLEFLFNEIEHHLQGDTVWDIRSAVNTFIATLSVLCRPELKTDLMKEMDRINGSLAKFGGSNNVNASALQKIREELSEKARILRNTEGQLGSCLRQNELVTALRQRESVPGGALAMDMPGYAHWLEQDVDSCRRDIRQWMIEFKMIKEAVNLVLELVRNSSTASSAVARSGFYQHSLDSEVSNQIVRVVLPSGVNYFPEISGGRHRFTVRFLNPNGFDRPTQSDKDIEFKLVCCAL